MAGAEVLIYAAKLRKLGLEPDELEALIDSKVRAIWGAELTTELKESSEVVKKNLCRRTNKTDPSKSDARRSTANVFYHLTCTAPDHTSSPAQALQDNPNLTAALGKAYHDDQDILFRLLRHDVKLDSDLSGSGGHLKRGENNLSAVEFCNTLDKATLEFLNEEKVEETGSITAAKERREELLKILKSCKDIVAARAYAGAAIEDDILNENNYKKWKKHMDILASFVALIVSLTRLVGPENF